MADGWITDGSTWTYASASTFTIAGDQTAIYTKGTRLKWTQTTVKYGVVVASSYSDPNTTVTIAVNTDYTIADAAISANFYSYAANPQGYPTWFTYTPTLTATVTPPTLGTGSVQTGRFCLNGKMCTCQFAISVGTTNFAAGSGEYRVSLPINSGGVLANQTRYFGAGIVRDSNVNTHYPMTFALLYNQTATTTWQMYSSANAIVTEVSPFTWAQSDSVYGTISYEIA